MNGGYSTGYFPLKRGTRQGDPLAPYLFILVIEILITMVRQNKNIVGININGQEFKQCVYADDTTYFLRDLDSLSELKKTLAEFSKLTSLCVNYQKSEIAWIGSVKNSKLSELDIKTLDLSKDAIRILGIYFTYNKILNKLLNFDRIANNLKNVLNTWRGRTLSLYGKTVILKTLAIPKLMYVCGMIEIPAGFIVEIKRILCNFLWNGSPKIKYTALIDNFVNGGIKFPDFSSMLAAQRVMWIKRIINSSDNQWKVIPLTYISLIGGKKSIGNNFKLKRNVFPPFYKSCFESWSEFTSNNPNTVKEILSQPLWNNRFLTKIFPIDFVSFMIKHNVVIIKDLYNVDGTLKTLSDIIPLSSQEYQKYYILWLSLISNIPTNWRTLIKNESKSNFLLTFNILPSKLITVSGTVKEIDNLDSKEIYSVCVNHQCEYPTKRVMFEKKYGNIFNWNKVCLNIYKTSIDPHSRIFQFKIVHDILPTNYKLYRWKVKDSSRCSYCFLENETCEHLFSECHTAITLYSNITNWANKFDILLPKLDKLTILYGIIPWSFENALLNHFILIYKQTLFYNRDSSNANLMAEFTRRIKNIYHLEDIIAKRKNKLPTHNKKWNQYAEFCC